MEDSDLQEEYTQQPQIYTDTVEGGDVPIQVQQIFEDPGSPWFPKRFWSGFKYPFKALLLCFTKSYSILALADTLVLNLIIVASIALGIFFGNVFIDLIVPHQADAWNFLWGFIPYNLATLRFGLVVFTCLILIMILFFASFLPFLILFNSNAQRLSYLVEKEMLGGDIYAHDFCFGEHLDRKKCCTPMWCKAFCVSKLKGIVKYGWKIVKSVIKRYIVKVLTILVTNILGLVFAALIPIPFMGIISYTIVIIGLAIIELPLFGLDVIFDRREYKFMDEVKTIWNNMIIFLGLGTGIIFLCIIFPPNLILLYPITIISCTRLFIHLEIHERTKESSFNPLCCL
eukprot:gene8814-764_t